MDWSAMQDWAALVTVVAAPLALVVWIRDQWRERLNDDEEIYQRLSDEYTEFLTLVLRNADLRLRSDSAPIALSEEQRERKQILLEILVSIFERSYILIYEERMNRQERRMWQSWEDYMREWCKRADFRDALPGLLEGEDPDFVAHIRRIADEVCNKPPARMGGVG